MTHDLKFQNMMDSLLVAHALDLWTTSMPHCTTIGDRRDVIAASAQSDAYVPPILFLRRVERFQALHDSALRMSCSVPLVLKCPNFVVMLPGSVSGTTHPSATTPEFDLRGLSFHAFTIFVPQQLS